MADLFLRAEALFLKYRPTMRAVLIGQDRGAAYVALAMFLAEGAADVPPAARDLIRSRLRDVGLS